MTETAPHKKCGAKTRAGGRCKMPGDGAGGRCRFHGGKSLSGPASGTYKHGRYSKYLKGGIGAKYNQALSESRLSLLDDIALTDARMAEAMESMGGSNLPELWIKMDDLRRQAESGSTDRAKAFRKIMSILADGAADARKWADVTQLQEHKRRLIETENKASAIAERSMSADEFVYRLRQLAEVIKDVVHDQRVRNNLTAAIERTVLGRTPGRASA